MAEGIKIRELQSVEALNEDDVLIIDTIIDGDLTSATTKQIRYDNLVESISSEDITLTGDITFEGDIVFEGNIELGLGDLTDVEIDSTVSTGQGLVYNGDKWVNGEVLSDTFNGDYLALEAKTNDPVTIEVTVGNKVGHRVPPQGGISSDKCFYLDGIEAPFMIFSPGRTYKFDQSHTSNAGHPLNFWSTMDSYFDPLNETYIERFGTPGLGGAFTQITMVNDMKYKTIYYECENHSYMGNGIFNPDGDDSFQHIIGPFVESLQRQIDDINSKIS